MISRRPYLIRAMYEWMVDTNQTPHLLVDAEVPAVQVPADYVQDGKIVLNVSPSAVMNLALGNDFIEFSARFGGMPQEVVLPTQAVLAIYARETGQGMLFNEDDDEPPPDGDDGAGGPDDKPGSRARKKPSLKVVK